ncbi:hypothetical protein [Vibrio crassostreae]|uniref:hypothetical protein n=1 Tax=Vibrio crassostreae TaxID=246167 RepID=UPI001B313464|nr:hypothetical protein [Vibrio crassostreae]
MINSELRAEIEDLDTAPVECDGFARLAAKALHRADVPYRAYVGCASCHKSGESVEPHFWIVCEDEIIDFRARMWLGTQAQHGFLPEAEYGQFYKGKEADIGILDDVTEAILKVPMPDMKALFGK